MEILEITEEMEKIATETESEKIMKITDKPKRNLFCDECENICPKIQTQLNQTPQQIIMWTISESLCYTFGISSELKFYNLSRCQ